MKASCIKYEKWLYLYRQGELNEKQSRLFEQHLSGCESCRHVLRDLGFQSDFVGKWQAHTAEISAPGEMTREIMDSVRIYRHLTPQRFSDRILDLFSMPRVQLAMLTVVVILAGFLLIQEGFVMYRIANLEQRMRYTGNTKPETDYRRVVGHLDRQLTYLPGELIKSYSNDYIVVDKQSLQDVLDRQNRLILQNEKLLTILEKEYPELARMMDKDTLRTGDIKLLQNKKIIQLLKSL